MSQNRIKLPSYAICLKANIEPKNFTALKSYYELMAKDSHLATLNKKQLLSKIKTATRDKKISSPVKKFLDNDLQLSSLD